MQQSQGPFGRSQRWFSGMNRIPFADYCSKEPSATATTRAFQDEATSGTVSELYRPWPVAGIEPARPGPTPGVLSIAKQSAPTALVFITVDPTGLEPVTRWLKASCSILLSYKSNCGQAINRKGLITYALPTAPPGSHLLWTGLEPVTLCPEEILSYGTGHAWTLTDLNRRPSGYEPGALTCLS